VLDTRHSRRDAAPNPDPLHGVGVGLRTPHFPVVLGDRPDIPWFEALIDNYMGDGGLPVKNLERVRNDYPVTFHGVGMSIGSSDPLNMDYLKRLKSLVDRFEPARISDHLCWVSVEGDYLHDLLPLPYIEEATRHVIERIQQVQDFLGRRILIENVSSYMNYKISEMQEWEFIQHIVEKSGCDILLDINNVHVSASNHNFDANDFLKGILVDRVKEFHLAGYEDKGTHLLDTHGEPVHDPVWTLYEQALERFGPVPTLIEWDNNLPTFEILHAEAKKAEQRMKRLSQHAA